MDVEAGIIAEAFFSCSVVFVWLDVLGVGEGSLWAEC